MFKTDSEEVNFLNERFPQLDDSELKVENIKRRLRLLWNITGLEFKAREPEVKVVAAEPMPDEAVEARIDNMRELLKPKPKEEPKEEKPFSVYRQPIKDDPDLLNMLEDKERKNKELAEAISKVMDKHKF